MWLLQTLTHKEISGFHNHYFLECCGLGCEYDVWGEHPVVWDVRVMFGVNILWSGMCV